jgi:hypothetical protein
MIEIRIYDNGKQVELNDLTLTGLFIVKGKAEIILADTEEQMLLEEHAQQ